MRVVFTGGSGKAGKHVIPELLAHGHSVLNVDLVPLDLPGVDNVTADITDAGQVFNALSMIHNLGELDNRPGPHHKQVPDAVVHFAAIPRVLLRPDNEAYRVNVMGTYNVLEAALKLGVRKVRKYHLALAPHLAHAQLRMPGDICVERDRLRCVPPRRSVTRSAQASVLTFARGVSQASASPRASGSPSTCR